LPDKNVLAAISCIDNLGKIFTIAVNDSRLFLAVSIAFFARVAGNLFCKRINTG
jgi:hypothetical protein